MGWIGSGLNLAGSREGDGREGDSREVSWSRLG